MGFGKGPSATPLHHCAGCVTFQRRRHSYAQQYLHALQIAVVESHFGPYLAGQGLCGPTVLEPEVSAVARVRHPVQGSRYRCWESICGLPGVGLASPSGCVLGQLQPDPGALLEDLHSDPHNHGNLRWESTGGAYALPGALEELSACGPRAAFPRNRTVGSSWYASAKEEIRRSQSGTCQPCRFTQIASGMVCLDDAGRTEAGILAEECRLLPDGCREMALCRYTGRDHSAYRAILSAVDREPDRCLSLGYAHGRAADEMRA